VRGQLLAHIDAATNRLPPRRAISDADVHEARKSIKRARAVLRLVQPALQADVYESSKSALRDAGRALSSARDAKVMADRFAEMLQRVDIEPFPVSTIAGTPRGTGRKLSPRRRRDLAAARTSLAAVRARMVDATLSATDWTPLGDGIRAIYRRALRAMPEESARAASSETLHEWRKRVKDYLHALEVIVASGRPSPIRRTISSARRLADALGEEHDLALLADALRASAEHEDRRVGKLLGAIEARRRRLRRRALRTGGRLYAQTPAVIEKQLRRSWP
jgi:CHAD domain-containing protein